MKSFLICIIIITGMMVNACSPSPLGVDTPRRITGQESQKSGRYSVPLSSLQLDITDGGAFLPWVLDYTDPLAVEIDTAVSPPAVWINRLHVADKSAGASAFSLVAVNLRVDSLTVQSGHVALIGSPNSGSNGADLTLWLPVAGTLQKVVVPCDGLKNNTTVWLTHLPSERTCVIHMLFSAQGNPGQTNAVVADGLLTVRY